MAGKISKKDKREIEQLKNQVARALADYDNLRKRVETEIEKRVIIEKARLVIKLLSVFDMLEEAQKHSQDAGLAIVTEEFKKVINDEGIEKIEVRKGDKFDENLCEVVEVVKRSGKAAGPEGIIEEVLLTGWKFKDGPVIRPVKVKVYK